jgi:hypothetical protein
VVDRWPSAFHCPYTSFVAFGSKRSVLMASSHLGDLPGNLEDFVEFSLQHATKAFRREHLQAPVHYSHLLILPQRCRGTSGCTLTRNASPCIRGRAGLRGEQYLHFERLQTRNHANSMLSSKLRQRNVFVGEVHLFSGGE